MDTELVFKALSDKSPRQLLDLLHQENGRTQNGLDETGQPLAMTTKRWGG